MSAPAGSPPRPRPVVQPWARRYWEAAREHRLELQYCEGCQRWIFYPRLACPHCSRDAPGWRQASGRGRIYSFTVVQANPPSAFAARLPYVVAVIILDEGVRLLSNVVQCDPATLRCEQPVEVAFEVLDEEFTLPVFRPLAGA